MEKINSKKAIELSKKLARQIGDSNPFYLASNCYFEERNGEEIVFDKDVTDDKIKPLFLPKKEINFLNQPISIATDEDLENLEKKGYKTDKAFFGNEYIHSTKEHIDLEGPKFRSFRKAINHFEKSYKYKVLEEYPKSKIVSFLKNWSKQKGEDISEETERNRKFELKASLKWIDLFEEIPHKKIFIEIDGKLAGFTAFLELHSDLWVALMQKTNHNYRGLSKFLYHLKAKEMKNIPFFTTGNPGDDEGLIKSKESLHPVKKIPVYVIKNIKIKQK